jgi:hypothetical protein
MRQSAGCQRAVGNDTNALGATEREHLALFFAVDEVEVILHRDKACPAMPLSNEERFLELPGVHGRGAKVANFADPDQIVESLYCFLNTIHLQSLYFVFLTEKSGRQACYTV